MLTTLKQTAHMAALAAWVVVLILTAGLITIASGIWVVLMALRDEIELRAEQRRLGD